MVLVVHILCALLSIVASTFTLLLPSANKLKLAYGLVIGTIATGTYLVVTTPLHILSTCIAGLFYVGSVSIILVGARHRLSQVRIRIKD